MPELNEAAIRDASDERRFDRGADYVRYVHGLTVSEQRADASIQAKRVYVVHVDWSGPRVTGSCTCWDEVEGLCKHRVAVALAALDAATPHTEEVDDDLATYVRGLSAGELAELLLSSARTDERLERRLRTRMSAATGDPKVAAKKLEQAASKALSPRGFVDYRRSFDVAAEASAFLDEIDQTLSAAPTVVQPALLRVLARLRTIGQHADDSSGVIGDAELRALTMYSRACREGGADPTKLANWMVKYHRESPGWPDLRLAAFADALGPKGLAKYRTAIEGWADSRPRKPADPTKPWLRDSERDLIESLLLELADHDGDLDRALALLDDPGRPQPAGAIRRLFAAGHTDEALRRLDAHVAERQPSSGRENDVWVTTEEAIAYYLDHDRRDDAIKIARVEFIRVPAAPAYRQLLAIAPGDEMREWALTVARERDEKFPSSAASIQIYLADGDVDAAWDAAAEFGAGLMWEELVKHSSADRPLACAQLICSQAEQYLDRADPRQYKQYAKLMKRARPLFVAGGDAAGFADYLREIRSRFERRPSFIGALDQAGLIPEQVEQDGA